MSDCEHPKLRTGDTFDQLRVVEPCLFCERNRLTAENAALRKDAKRYRFIKRWVRRLDIVGYSLTCNEHFEPRIDEAMEHGKDE